MAITKSIRLAIHSNISNIGEGGVREGAAEITDSAHDAEMTVTESSVIIKYKETTEGGDVISKITSEGDTVTVERSGAIRSVMVFKPGSVYRSLYEIPPFSFDMAITVKAMKNSITLFGGSADILYTMDIGGAQKSCRMKITLGGGEL
ncbi:MAG: DUF1934 domain-containing protein [Clostridia bacterium]|nr:DUF1934 domain-containing protein [Clostridia bacterium]